ncbi:hypothetical protein DQ239_13410 [Blastococcus sp. TF02-09]|uniref:hypothetical protein n=1 Tax=Blastococcus sp. TF02-09 TaxID=2250576 RepID=UPI000DEA4675|nr:hypothetical protein [Blastococcus sp. TF02-9]RBY76541.1 hypothetical protein DQ239_13410 [Blastococcus sp. TF02-9]
MRIRTFTAPAALAAGALLLTACGSSPLEGKNGPEVAELAADALEEAGSVHLKGTLSQDGEEAEIDMQLQGDNAAGSITVQDMEIELINIGGDVYAKATPDFLASYGVTAEDAEQYDGQWVAFPADGSSGFEEFNLTQTVEQLRGDDAEDGTDKDELDGDDVVVVTLEDGTELSVRDDDPPYPLELADDEGTFTFTEHGEDEDISAPEDVIELEQITAS